MPLNTTGMGRGLVQPMPKGPAEGAGKKKGRGADPTFGHGLVLTGWRRVSGPRSFAIGTVVDFLKKMIYCWASQPFIIAMNTSRQLATAAANAVRKHMESARSARTALRQSTGLFGT